MRDYARIASKIVQTSWLITPEGLSLILNIMDARMHGVNVSDEELALRLSAVEPKGNQYENASIQNGVGIIPVYGPIFGKANMMTQLSGATSMEAFRSDLKAMLADDGVKSIIMDIDSPGGSSEMIAEAGQEIFAGRDIKPITAVANGLAGSAAYWLASQASTFYVSPSGSVGSIGVYTVHQDKSGADEKSGNKFTFVSAGPYKTEGNPHEPLSAEGVAYRQEVVNELYDEFLNAVALGRNVSAEEVKANYGGGRMLLPKKALAAGMVDGIAEFDAVVASADRAPAQHVSVAVGGKQYAAVLDDNGVYTFDLDASVADYEHSEPGTGSPPQPRLPDHVEPDIASGSRRPDLTDNLPNEADQPGAPKASSINDVNGGNMDLELLFKLFGIADSDETALLAAITEAHTEASALRADVKLAGQEKDLAEKYPDVWTQIQNDRNDKLETEATTFAGSMQMFKRASGEDLIETNIGLSALATNVVKDSYLKVAKSEFQLSDFEILVKTITQGGTLEYGEKGTNLSEELPEFDTTTATGVANARNLFATKVAEIQEADKLEYRAAVVEATKRYPDLAEAYRATTHA